MIARSRVARIGAVAALVIFAISAVSSVWLGTLNESASRGSLPLLLATGCFVVVGSVILTKRPENLIGWLFCVIGLLWATGALASEYARYAIVEPGALPAPWIAAWYAEWNWIAFWFATLVATPMLFPTGRALSPVWGRALILITIVASGVIVLAAMDPNLGIEGSHHHLANPLGTSLGRDPDDSGLGAVLFPLMFGGAASAAVSLFLRFRRSRRDERLQLKWFTFAGVLTVVGFFVLGIGGFDTSSWGEVFYSILVALVPVAAGVAILRHRLYDIDVVINRALVYGSLTGILAAAYFGIVVVLQQVLPLARNSDLAVAASTLAVAALFRPIRTRLQSFIDRRFYRRKYDAIRTIESFNLQVRQQTDLDALESQLLGVVSDTMQPTHVSLWLKGATS